PSKRPNRPTAAINYLHEAPAPSCSLHRDRPSSMARATHDHVAPGDHSNNRYWKISSNPSRRYTEYPIDDAPRTTTEQPSSRASIIAYLVIAAPNPRRRTSGTVHTK